MATKTAKKKAQKPSIWNEISTPLKATLCASLTILVGMAIIAVAIIFGAATIEVGPFAVEYRKSAVKPEELYPDLNYLLKKEGVIKVSVWAPAEGKPGCEQRLIYKPDQKEPGKGSIRCKKIN